MSQKTGRNEPCPCGSGKKYKKCCGGRNKHNRNTETRFGAPPDAGKSPVQHYDLDWMWREQGLDRDAVIHSADEEWLSDLCADDAGLDDPAMFGDGDGDGDGYGYGYDDEDQASYLRQALFSAVKEQIDGNNPPEVRQTRDRLLKTGYCDDDIMQMLTTVLLYEMHAIMTQGRPFDPDSYNRALHNLPQLPDDD